MGQITLDTVFKCLRNNEDNMVIFAMLPDPLKEGIRDLWDELIHNKNFVKFGFEGWRECRDQGPQKHVVYALRKPVADTAALNANEETKNPKTLVLNGIDINSKLKDIEDRITSLEKAMSFLICETGCSESEIKNPRPFPIIKPVDIAYILGLSKD